MYILQRFSWTSTNAAQGNSLAAVKKCLQFMYLGNRTYASAIEDLHYEWHVNIFLTIPQPLRLLQF